MRIFKNNKVCYASSTINFNPQETLNFSEINYRNMLCVADRIQCVNRILWYELISAFTSHDIETMLYDKGAICCFKDDDTVIFSPFTLKGKISKKGKLYKIQPITLDGKPYGDLKRVYTPDCNFDFDTDCCIIIKDYTGAITNDKIIPRSTLNASTTICDEVKVYRQLVYNIVMAVKKILVSGVSEEQRKVIEENTKLIFNPSQPILMFKGENFAEKYSITQFVDKVDVDSFTRAISFYNKIRRNFNGVPAPDTFEKKERLITPEMEDVGKGTNLILFDALMNRQTGFLGFGEAPAKVRVFIELGPEQTAVDYINEAFNLNIRVEINKDILGGGDSGSVHKDMENEGSDSQYRSVQRVG